MVLSSNKIYMFHMLTIIFFNYTKGSLASFNEVQYNDTLLMTAVIKENIEKINTLSNHTHLDETIKQEVAAISIGSTVYDKGIEQVVAYKWCIAQSNNSNKDINTVVVISQYFLSLIATFASDSFNHLLSFELDNSFLKKIEKQSTMVQRQLDNVFQNAKAGLDKHNIKIDLISLDTIFNEFLTVCFRVAFLTDYLNKQYTTLLDSQENETFFKGYDAIDKDDFSFKEMIPLWQEIVVAYGGYMVPIFTNNGSLGLNCINYGILNNILPVGIAAPSANLYPAHAGMVGGRIGLLLHDFQHAGDIANNHLRYDDSFVILKKLFLNLVCTMKNEKDVAILKLTKEKLIGLFFCLHEMTPKTDTRWFFDIAVDSFSGLATKHLIQKMSGLKKFSDYSIEKKIKLDLFESIDLLKLFILIDKNFKKEINEQCTFLSFKEGIPVFADPQDMSNLDKINAFVQKVLVPRITSLYSLLCKDCDALSK